MFLLPLALTIFGFSIESVESERFSGAAATGAGSSFFLLAGFLAGLTSGSVFEGANSEPASVETGPGAFPSAAAGAVSPSGELLGAATVFSFLGFGFSKSVGSFDSAI